MHTFTLIFLTFLAALMAMRLWLAARHIAHIARCRDAVPAEFAEHIALDAHQKAADYSIEKTRLGMKETIADGLFLLLITLGGGILWIDGLSAQWLANGYARGIATVFGVMLLSGIVFLPFELIRTFDIEARYGFNKMTIGLYIVDAIKGIALALLVGVPLLLVTFWLIESMGAYWWFYVWLVWLGFSALMIAVYPAFIAPLFNKFSPLDNDSLKKRIENLLARCGFRAQGLYVMDGSKRSSHGNAYFTGFGKTKRIVFFDTLLARLAPAEIEAVLAHELGHFKLRHVLKRMLWIFGASLAFLWLLAQLMHQGWFYEALNVQSPSTAMALILFFIVVPQFTFLLQPLTSFYSRRHEFEADSYAARQASGGDLISALVKLYQDNAATLTPDPLHSAFYDSHPPAPLRIARLQSSVQ